MINFRFYLLIGLIALFTGCINPNKLSMGIVQEPKNVQYKESDFKNIIARKDILANDDIKNKLKFITQNCVKKYASINNFVYLDERYSVNYWFEISDNNITIESNIRNILKKKNDLQNEALLLGGTQGNRIFKIDLPYKLEKVNDSTYKITIYNNENIIVTESFNKETNKAYEPTVWNIPIDRFKVTVNNIANCI